MVPNTSNSQQERSFESSNFFISTSSGYGKMHHCRKRRHFPLLSVTNGVDTSVRALRNYFLYGNMDCVALLVVNRGRKKGAL